MKHSQSAFSVCRRTGGQIHEGQWWVQRGQYYAGGVRVRHILSFYLIPHLVSLNHKCAYICFAVLLKIHTEAHWRELSLYFYSDTPRTSRYSSVV